MCYHNKKKQLNHINEKINDKKTTQSKIHFWAQNYKTYTFIYYLKSKFYTDFNGIICLDLVKKLKSFFTIVVLSSFHNNCIGEILFIAKTKHIPLP